MKRFDMHKTFLLDRFKHRIRYIVDIGVMILITVAIILMAVFK